MRWQAGPTTPSSRLLDTKTEVTPTGICFAEYEKTDALAICQPCSMVTGRAPWIFISAQMVFQLNDICHYKTYSYLPQFVHIQILTLCNSLSAGKVF